MSSIDSKRYKDILETKRQEILSLPNRSIEVDEALRTGDWVDHSSKENDLHVNLALKQTDTKLLRAIEEALQRVDTEAARRKSDLETCHRRDSTF